MPRCCRTPQLRAIRPGDPGDDYLLALAAGAHALFITGDGRLLELADRAPIHTPAELVDLIDLD